MLIFTAMIERDQIEIIVKPSFWEAYCATVFVTARALRKLFYTAGVVLALTVASLLFAWTHPRNPEDWTRLMDNVGPLLWLAVAVTIAAIGFPLLAAWKLRNDPHFAKGLRYVFTETVVCVDGAVAKSQLSWDAFMDAAETNSSYYLFQNRGLANLFPKRCFASAQEVNVFREMLRSRFPKSRLGKD